MAYVITEACIDVKDQSCIEVCPVDCIYAEDEDRICYIEPEACIDCAVCLSACPVGAIFTADTTPAASLDFLEINKLWFTDKEQARAKVTEKAAD
jgi:NAD-dependent dihydropyrimidine dehydrogenase PreA subunit